jgi:2-keto-4-pentenoate hydratase
MIDQRIADGMRAQLAARDEQLARGERQIGWKVGFGAPAAAAALGIDRPLVGFMLARAVLPDGASVPVGAWTAPRVEPEIAVHLAHDVAPDASRADVQQAIGGLSAAIELVDVHPPPEEVPAILAGNIFHRHVLLGPVDATRSTGEGIGGRLLVDGQEVAATDDPSALTGELVEVVRLTAELLGACGDRLRAGQLVITGSVVPPLDVSPGQRVTAELGPLGELTVELR